MLKLLYTYIKSLFTPTDITLTLNGSQLTFTKEGDVKLKASRNLIVNGKHIFENCTPEQIKEVLTNPFNEDLFQYNMPSLSFPLQPLTLQEKLCLEQLD